MQEVRKSQNRDFESQPGVEYELREYGMQPGDFPGFRRLRATASSSGLKGSEILWPSDVVIFHRSDSSLLTNLVISRSPFLCAPFFRREMELAEMGHWRKKRPDLPVSLLMVLHALQLECDKSIDLTASSHRSCFFCPSRDSRDEAAPTVSVPTGARIKER